MDRSKAIHIRLSPTEAFSMFYIHSVYKKPVVEEFQVEKEAMILKGVRTKSPAIMEYYGFEDMKEFHSLDLKLGAVFLIRRGMGEGQGLIVRDRKIYLSEIGEKGDTYLADLPCGYYFSHIDCPCGFCDTTQTANPKQEQFFVLVQENDSLQRIYE